MWLFMSHHPNHSTSESASQLQRYYQLHARAYDATRWSFLFGRGTLLDCISRISTPKRILEVGCGTGKNLKTLAHRFPSAEITGIDLSDSMLAQARAKLATRSLNIRLIQGAYDKPVHEPDAKFDLVLCSYALSMFNPGWERALDCANADLAAGGLIAVVDFHDSGFKLFQKWMAVNYVRMEGHLRPKLQRDFAPIDDRVRRAYAGVWEYLLFIGKKV